MLTLPFYSFQPETWLFADSALVAVARRKCHYEVCKHALRSACCWSVCSSLILLFV